MTKREKLPRPAKELAELAEHYGDNDTSVEMEAGEWVDPRPMATTSLRLPGAVVTALKEEAQSKGVRYTALVREVLEDHVAHQEPAIDVVDLQARLEHLTVLVERLVERAGLQPGAKAREPEHSAC
jgi:predicted DNA-binding protein